MATQSFAEISYGPLGLALMRAGKAPEQALKGLLASDSLAEQRQVGFVDAQGRVATHTGSKCIQAAGHRQGKGYSVQANLMLNDTVWDAMAEAFEGAKGDLAERLVVALKGAEAVGGDIRGKQSAAMLVVGGERTGNYWGGRIFDLRVDDSPTPLEELRRLLAISRAYTHGDNAERALVEGASDKAEADLAAAEFNRAVELMPDIESNPEQLFWYAVALTRVGRVQGCNASIPAGLCGRRRVARAGATAGARGLFPQDAQNC